MMRAMKNQTLSMMFAACLMAATAHAADKPKEGSIGKGTGAMLSKEQLRSCLARKPRLAEQEADLLKEQNALAAIKEDVARSGEALKTKLETVDRTSAEAVAAYNEQTEARDKQIDDYQARATAFNTRVDASKVDREAYAKNCENRRYLEDDEIAIKRGK